MFTKTKIALAATLVLGTAALAQATEFDPNLSNRYPAFNGPRAIAPYQNAPVFEGRNVGRIPRQAIQPGTVYDPVTPPVAGGGL